MRTLSVLLMLFLIVPLLVAQANLDDRIHDEVMAKLANDTEVRGGGLDVTVKNGMVTLKGQVHTEKAKEKAEKLVKKIKGVASVDNQLKVFGAD
jgi:hyperosmotically inducible protein